jgi:hypothetical protein
MILQVPVPPRPATQARPRSFHVIEILSPSSAAHDLGIKRNLYAKYGVQEYWIVNPDAKTVESLVWTEAGYVVRSASGLFPDLNLNTIFCETGDSAGTP